MTPEQQATQQPRAWALDRWPRIAAGVLRRRHRPHGLLRHADASTAHGASTSTRTRARDNLPHAGQAGRGRGRACSASAMRWCRSTARSARCTGHQPCCRLQSRRRAASSSARRQHPGRHQPHRSRSSSTPTRRGPWEFKPAQRSIEVHPGELATVMYEFQQRAEPPHGRRRRSRATRRSRRRRTSTSSSASASTQQTLDSRARRSSCRWCS